MQDFIAKKLSKIIDSKIEFVEVKKAKKRAEPENEEDSLKLLKGYKKFIKLKDPEEDNFIKNRKKVPITKRKIEEEDMGSDASTNFKSIAVDSQDIQKELESWTERSKNKAIEYKTIKSVGYLREPTNEYTKLRNKNNWTESKISTTKSHVKGIREISELRDT